MMKQTAVLLILSLTPAACVSSSTYRKKDAELGALRQATLSQQEASRAREDDLETALARSRAEQATLARKLATTSEDRDVLRDVNANDRALLVQMKKQLESLGQHVDTLTHEKGSFAAGMEEAYVRIKQLEEQKVAAEQRAATFHDLVRRLRAMIDAGTLDVVVRDGRMLIVMPNDVLFDSGRTEIKPGGRATLTAVARALASVTDRRFTVIGHTDDIPIHTARFRSNWDLSTARAVEVTLFLIEGGLKPGALSAAGRGEFDPLAPNTGESGRQHNRRVEIALEPKITELPAQPDPGVATAP